MCGIFGVIDFKNSSVSPAVLSKMGETLAHRGPDDQGMVLFGQGRSLEVKDWATRSSWETSFEVGLGHRRLSIIDLSEEAHQPMSNEDGTVWIVFNGEIYNFQDLRTGLEESGHRFKSKSDTEVILHGYEEWGIDCLKNFRGMFAFGLWDSRLKRLFLARDRLGEKPVVYSRTNGSFAFASELKALLQIPGFERKLSRSALNHYLTYQYVPSPDSIFEGIHKLPPGHYLVFDARGHVTTERYWKLNLSPMRGAQASIKEMGERLREKVEESVRLRLVSDVPIGAFLSGGIDSSLIVGIMAKLTGTPVRTFSIGFEEKGFDELTYARTVSKHFSTDHQEYVVKPNAIEILPKLAWYYNEPFADSSAIPTYYVAKVTRDHVKVVLTGDAGDENFAGYPRYLRSKWVAEFTKLPQTLRRDLLPIILRGFSHFHWKEERFNRLADFVQQLSKNQARNYSEQVKIFNDREKEDLFSEEFARTLENKDTLGYLLTKYAEPEAATLIDRLLYLDINTYLPEDLLVKTDIATMANSLEARVPFLDHRLMEFVATIPSSLKLNGNVTKYILKEAYADFLPKEILKRKKMGFGVPVSRWFRKELKDYMFEVLLDHRTLNRGYFKREEIERLLREHVASTYDHSAKIWALLFLEEWFRIYLDTGGIGSGV